MSNEDMPDVGGKAAAMAKLKQVESLMINAVDAAQTLLPNFEACIVLAVKGKNDPRTSMFFTQMQFERLLQIVTSHATPVQLAAVPRPGAAATPVVNHETLLTAMKAANAMLASGRTASARRVLEEMLSDVKQCASNRLN